MEVLLPDSPAYETARAPEIPNFSEVRPAAVIRCADAADVAEALAYARRLGVRAAPRSGGHCFAGRSSTSGVVVDVGPMRAVSVSGSVATIGAGARLGELYDALDGLGLTIPAGCGPTVGIAGLVLGGGLGLLGRLHGLTCDSLLAAEVVLADGTVVECDEERHPDLFWALRGAGGGHFGIVTSLVFRTVPAPFVTRFELTWPFSDAPAVVAAWQDWAPDAPGELQASLQVTTERAFLFGTMVGGEADTAALIDLLVAGAGAEPTARSYVHQPHREAKRALAEFGEAEPGPRFAKSEFFRQGLPAEAIAALVDRLEPSRELNFTPWGGAYNRVPEDATAFAHRNERFLLEHLTILESSEADSDAARRWAAESWAHAHPWGSGRVYPNFPDPDLADWPEAYHGENLERLRRVKAAYDPDRVFRFHQSL
jgi:FAD/FMN-containing dehydrogenase